MFLVLVAVGIACLCVLVYMLFYASPRANPAIKDADHSLVRLDPSPSRPIAGKCVVRS